MRFPIEPSCKPVARPRGKIPKEPPVRTMNDGDRLWIEFGPGNRQRYHEWRLRREQLERHKRVGALWREWWAVSQKLARPNALENKRAFDVRLRAHLAVLNRTALRSQGGPA